MGKGGLSEGDPEWSGNFASLSTYSRIVARLQWDAEAIDLTADARAWPGLPEARRRRLTTLLAGFCVAEDAVAEHLVPFADVAEKAESSNSNNSMMMWVFFLQRRDEDRHARLFDRIGAEVLGLPGATPHERRQAARSRVPPALLELFEVTLPTMAADLAAGRTELSEGIGLYHMVLEGAVFTAGQRALLDDLADGALPGVREGIERVDTDERWHIGFGMRCLAEAGAAAHSVVDGVLARAAEAGAAWGDVVPVATREKVVELCRRRMAVAGLVGAETAETAETAD